MPYSNRHIIAKPRPYRLLAVIICTIVLTLLTQQWLTSRRTSTAMPSSQLIAVQRQAIDRLQQQLEQLSAEKEHLLALEGIAATAQSELLLEKATTERLKQQLAQLQQQVRAQRDLIQFYRSVTDGNASTKLQFRELDLHATNSDPDMILFRLIVSQGEKVTRPITGTVIFTLDFQHDHQMRHQLIAEHPLKLRLVQVIEGKFKLSPHQKPVSVTVTLKQKKKTVLSKTFDWRLRQHP